MNQLAEFFRKLFDAADFPPRWHCGKWTEFHGWFYIISDLLIWSAYFAIPVIIVNYLSKRKNLRFHRIYFLFAAFILACGTTHLMDVITFWFPAYRLSALIRFITGVLSWATVFALVRVLPVAFSLKTSSELEQEAEQRRLAEEELKIKNQQLEEAQELAKMGNWEWDVKTDKVTWSKGLHRIYETDPAKPINFESFLELLGPDEKDRVAAIIKNVFDTGEFTEYHHRVLFADGREKIFHARGEAIKNGNGEIIKMIGTAVDVTEEKRTEWILLEKTAELERINEELQQLAYAASHDLQEPLRKMRVFIDMMLKKIDDKESAEKYAARVQLAAERMSELIKSILEYSRISNRNKLFVPVDLNEILTHVKSDLELLITEKKAIITSDPLPVVYGIPQQLQQLFANLINNSLKFSPTAPNISIRARNLSYEEVHNNAALNENLKYAELVFTDNGIGFEPEFASQIFTMFKRLDHQYSGTGIGLAICKKIVDNHKGSISAESEKGKGSSFTVCLPLQG
jgi:signal transduction histidine kinase